MNGVASTLQGREQEQNQQGDEEEHQGDGQPGDRDEVDCATEAHICGVQAGRVVGPSFVGVRVDPPSSVLQAHLLRGKVIIEAKVDEVRAILCLDEAWRRGVEAGPGVKDDGTPGLVVILLLFGSIKTFQQPGNKVGMLGG